MTTSVCIYIQRDSYRLPIEMPMVPLDPENETVSHCVSHLANFKLEIRDFFKLVFIFPHYSLDAKPSVFYLSTNDNATGNA